MRPELGCASATPRCLRCLGLSRCVVGCTTIGWLASLCQLDERSIPRFGVGRRADVNIRLPDTTRSHCRPMLPDHLATDWRSCCVICIYALTRSGLSPGPSPWCALRTAAAHPLRVRPWSCICERNATVRPRRGSANLVASGCDALWRESCQSPATTSACDTEPVTRNQPAA